MTNVFPLPHSLPTLQVSNQDLRSRRVNCRQKEKAYALTSQQERERKFAPCRREPQQTLPPQPYNLLCWSVMPHHFREAVRYRRRAPLFGQAMANSAAGSSEIIGGEGHASLELLSSGVLCKVPEYA